ncbi:SUMF1/EgtB/PvdO family nonheme iron enzyme [Iodidimonas sp. SYSU 1G8]|uniref:formylglycine-generating enzyme family protein n=1 Tax=Iodidimonas sp. SYSU 1G8 TaxID=3133967 RepID=UPI0031FECE6A
MREPITPRGRYEAVGKEGKLAAVISGVLAVVVVIGVLITLFIFSRDTPEAPPEPQKVQTLPAQPTADAATGSEAVTAFKDCPNCPMLVTIPAGAFTMGLRQEEILADNVPLMQQQSEAPVHGVTIKHAFALGQTEVTRAQFEAFVNETGHQALGCVVHDGNSWVSDRSKSWRDPGFEQEEDHPVVCVNHADATAFAEWMSRRTGKRYRLPSETEWEYVARAGLDGAHPWGDKPALACAHGNVADRSHAARFSSKTALMFFPCQTGYVYTAPVAHYQANPMGVFDLYGNVREIVADCWTPSYWGKELGSAARTVDACETMVARGGGWFDAPPNVRPARRFREDLGQRRADQGFRIARDVPLAGTGQ